MATKADIIEKLTAAGIPHDPNATVASLKTLLHPEDQSAMADAQEPPAPKTADPRQVRWDAFLAKAEAERIEDGTHLIFLAQKHAGEFDKIPDSF